MNVAVRYFASVREALGSGESVAIGAGADIAALRAALVARGGRHAEALGRARALRSARNRVLCDEKTPLADGDEVGFFPPLTGG
jgi:sulfur-carrier protein